jgi:folate-binding protein YgfZ
MQANSFDGVTALTHWGVLRASGADAATFLHNQLTQDFVLLKDPQARLAAFCNAKGRMQASFIGFKRGDSEVLLVMHRSLLAQTLKRLSMFVLRAKVQLTDVSDTTALYGALGASAQALLPQTTPWSRHALDAHTDAVALYPAWGQARALWVGPPGSAPAGPPITLDAWNWAEVHAGVAMLEPASFEAFVPQMLNYESVDGVNFKKGCYPGQEVVARSQFRGTLKRRAYVVHCAATVQAGQEVFSAADPSQPCGQLAQVATWQGAHAAIACLQTASAETPLHVGSSSGPLLQLQPLPYPLRDDI